MKYLLVLAATAAALSVTAPAMAQEAPRAVPVVAQDADRAEREALVRRYLTAIQMDKLMNGMMESMMGSMLEDSEIPEEKRELVRDAALAAFANVMPQMNDAMIDMYAEAFTRDELQQLVAFYESPVGRSMMSKTVMLTRQSGELYESFGAAMEEEMMKQLCLRMDCSALTDDVAPTAKR
ncbi:DUF2059 domain-containing protein [Brevundimonas sp. Root1279]|uniref:DUF2059 domain-containing protein n=1 Tax=Brevundimonas sp. Root1279 TaxID=1736443 RepID=UPI000700DC11|nr:DUF2059 domain-containing protein [Brevundimonas sp. Root1279]KQW79660.1 hypothetical protein ASC65_13990 [Brevundimonas sp. Root1279]